MKQMICYLYEFHNNQKTRNVGFVRCVPYGEKMMFQFHGKGMDFTGVEEFRVYVFRMKDGVCYVRFLEQIDGVRGNINSMIEVSGGDASGNVGDDDELDQYDGLLLMQPQGQTYVAAWKNIDVDVEHIREMSQAEESVAQGEEDVVQADVAMDSQKMEDTDVHQDIESVIQEDVEINSQDNEHTNVQYKVSSTLDTPSTPPEAEPTVSTSPQVSPTPDPAIQAAAAQQGPSYEKISRNDIARLPRKEWKLANNSFLLHGFYNYKHLLFIEEEGQLYLGVPGVYHQKEVEAARAFGFTCFHRTERDLELDEEECNDADDFGYWCRPVETLHQN